MADFFQDGDAQAATGAAYRVLARKYRPQNFADLIGQDAMVRTLRNAFKAGRIPQAWMLTGVRGVGKTTTARILARALNYKAPGHDAPQIDFETEGEHCRAIMDGRHVDVMEMDAASHTGIDDIKQIIDGVRYAPASARYKVYIIDEIHMLSDKAFNALLKTLEEPPPHVKFIFATTEIRKVPVTILSRCQRFDLRRIDPGLIVDHLRRIVEAEGVEAEDAALAMIARAGEGSARDSLSLLDQAIAHGNGSVEAESVRAMLGLADRSRTIDLFEHLMKGEMPEALSVFRDLYDAGADPVVILSDLAAFNHLVTRLKFVETAGDDASLSIDEKSRGKEYAAALGIRVLSRTWQLLLKGIPEVENAPRPVDAAEMVLVRIAHAAELPTLDEVIRTAGDNAGAAGAPVRAPSGNGGGPAAMAVGVATGVAGIPTGGATARLAATTPVPQPVTARQDAIPGVEIRSLADIAELAEKHRDMQFKVMLRQFVRPVSVEPGRLAVSLADGAPKTLLNDISTRLKAWTGSNWMVSLSREDGGRTLAEADTAARETAVADARSDPDIAAALAMFPGARIIDVRLRQAATDAGEAVAPVEEFPDNPDEENSE